ncbi:hypothetical protein D9M71_792290 [compost metagenome]
MMIEHHDNSSSRTRLNVLSEVRRVGVGDAKGHIAQLPLTAATTVDCQLRLIQVAVSLL